MDIIDTTPMDLQPPDMSGSGDETNTGEETAGGSESTGNGEEERDWSKLSVALPEGVKEALSVRENHGHAAAGVRQMRGILKELAKHFRHIEVKAAADAAGYSEAFDVADMIETLRMTCSELGHIAGNRVAIEWFTQPRTRWGSMLRSIAAMARLRLRSATSRRR